MANHKSAEKRNRQSQIRRLRNRMNKKEMKTAIRRFNEVIESGSGEENNEALRKVTKVIARTARKGSIHKKSASRKISRLARRLRPQEEAVA